jgi:hypothetical protein
VLVGGVGLNLALLGYFKYLDFLLGNVNAALDIALHALRADAARSLRALERGSCPCARA